MEAPGPENVSDYVNVHRFKPRDDDGPREPPPGWDGRDEPRASPIRLKATPFTWRDPTTFPRREWLFGYHLIRKFMSCTVAPGGLGKTSLVLAEAVAMASGRNLTGTEPRKGALRVWVMNLEDPLEEVERRVLAICLHFGIRPEEIEGRLFLDSGREISIVMATTTRNGTEIATPVVEALRDEIRAREIDVLVVDPFVKSHRVQENDNAAIDVVATAFAGVADATGCAIELVHHVRKGHGGEITVEDGRGAVALLSAVRSARVLNPMSREEAAQAGGLTAREYFRVTNGKANLAPPPDRSDWFHLRSVSLGNGDGGLLDEGDKVGVVEGWEWPDLMAEVTVSHLRRVQEIVSKGEWRADVQTRERWVGAAVAQALKCDWDDKTRRGTINKALATWFQTNMLVKVRKIDGHRNERTFVEVGEWAKD